MNLIRRWSYDPDRRSATIREIAAAVLEARQRFTYDDHPDWRGRSYDYRRWMADTYAAAGIPLDDQRTIQGSIRYHVGNLLRERVDPDELTAAGLEPTSPAERMAAAREQVASAMADLRSGDLRAHIAATVAAIDAAEEQAAGLEPDARAELLDAVEALNEAMAALRDRLECRKCR